MLIICGACHASEFESNSRCDYEPTISRIQYGSHSYICFNNTFFLHDPDCGCADRWGGFAISKEGALMHRFEIYRFPSSHYD